MAVDPTTQRLAAIEAEIQRRIEEAARAAAAAAQRQAQAALLAAQIAARLATQTGSPSVFQPPQMPKIDLKPPASAQLSPEETAAYVAVAKVIATKDPSVDPHEVIANSPQLLNWISQSVAVQQDGGDTAQFNQDLGKLNLNNGTATFASGTTNTYDSGTPGTTTSPGSGGNPTGTYSNVNDPASAFAAFQQLSPDVKVYPNGPPTQNAYDLAKTVEGKNTADLNYANSTKIGQEMDDNQRDPTVNCANFVSGVLAAAGQISTATGHDQRSNGAQNLSDNLANDPRWRTTSLNDAKPGDVVCMAPGGIAGQDRHIVMFAGWKDGQVGGTPLFIGSNNVNSDGSQSVTTETMNYPIVRVSHFMGGTSDACAIDASGMKSIMPNVDPAVAQKAAPVLQQALSSAKITDPKESAAFVAMVAQQTHEFTTPDAYATVVAFAAKFKQDPSIAPLAKDGQLNKVAEKLGMQVTPDQISAGDRDAQVAQRIDTIFASGNPAAASHKVQDESGNMVTVGQLCVEEGRKHQMDPFLFMAIAKQETVYGTQGVGVSKMLGVSAYDNNPDGNFGMNGLSAQIINGAQTFDRLRSQNGSGPNDPIDKQIAAVNGYKNGDPALGRPGQVWASDGTWYTHVTANYHELTKDGNGLGPPQIGEKYYDKALNLFAPPDTSSSSSSGASSASGVGGTSGFDGTTSSNAAVAAAQAAKDGTTVIPTAELNTLQRQTKSLGYDINQQTLWALLQMLSDSYGDIINALSNDGDFQTFIKSQPGMKNWRPGQPVPKAMIAAFLSKKMKAKGLTVDKNGVIHGKNGQALNGWQDVSKALGLKPAKGPGVDLSQDPNAPPANWSGDPNVSPDSTATPSDSTAPADPTAPSSLPVTTVPPAAPGGAPSPALFTVPATPTTGPSATTSSPATASTATLTRRYIRG
jgi:hypothetical protein